MSPIGNGKKTPPFPDDPDPILSGDASALVMDVQKIKTVKDFGEIPFTEFDIHKDW